MRKKKKKVGQEGLRRGKRRRKERVVSNVSCSLPGQDTLTSCPCQEETRDKGSQLQQRGLVPSAGKLVHKYPECGQDVSLSEESQGLATEKTDNGHGE